MDKIQRLQENVFTEIAKIIALAQLKIALPKAMKKMEANPEIMDALKSLEKNTKELDDMIKKYKEKYPDNPKYKDK